MGVQYLHEFGFVHRDLNKLENNIMMSDSSDDAVPKIVDSGLAKIIGPSNNTAYLARSLLAHWAMLHPRHPPHKQPYTLLCDMWSRLGCIIYALLSGA